MADAEPREPAAAAPDARVREEWRRLERKRIDEEIAEAREDVGSAGPSARRLHWLVWLAFAVALLAGIVVTALVNNVFDPRS